MKHFDRDEALAAVASLLTGVNVLIWLFVLAEAFGVFQ